MSELLPCPFCGGEAFVDTVEHPKENRPNEYRFHGQILCYKCQATAGTTGFDLTHEEATKKAIAVWNRRADARQTALQTGICPMCEDCPDGCPIETPEDSKNKGAKE